MKSGIVLAMIFSLATTAMFAQNTSESSGSTTNVKRGMTTFGIRAGGNYTNIINKDADQSEWLPGVQAGLNVELPLGIGVYLQPNVLFSMKGAKYTDNSKIRLNYIEVPINLVFKPMTGTSNIIFGFGPYFSYAVAGRIISTNGDTRDLNYGGTFSTGDVTTYFRRADAGGNILIGYEFANKFSFQANGQLGFKNINKKALTASTGDIRWRNAGVGLSLGYRF
jgi:hypothetical protein